MKYFIAMNGCQSGPYTEDQVREMLRNGLITRVQLAWREELQSWIPLDQVIMLDARTMPPLPVQNSQGTVNKSDFKKFSAILFPALSGVVLLCMLICGLLGLFASWGAGGFALFVVGFVIFKVILKK